MANLAIFVHYSSQLILKNYEKHYLLALSKNYEIIFISNSPLNNDSLDWLNENKIRAILRENNGFDFGAYIDFFNKNNAKLKGYQNILITNNSFYGPIGELPPPEKLLCGADLFGWYLHPQMGGTKMHLQSYFILFGSKIIESGELFKFLSNLPIPEVFEEAIQIETNLTAHFTRLGYKISFKSSYESTGKLFENPSMLLPDVLLNSGVPLIKRKALFLPYEYYLKNSYGNHIENAINIASQKNYPKELIYEDLLDKPQSLTFPHLQHFFILDKVIDKINIAKKNKRTISLILFVYYEELFKQNFTIIETFLSLKAKILIVSSNKDILEIYDHKFKGKVDIELVKNKGRNEYAYFVSGLPYLKSSDYTCFLHDKKSCSETPAIRGFDWNAFCIDNLVPNETYILNLLQKFEEHPEIGLLFPPPPLFSKWKIIPSTVWNNPDNLKLARKLYRQLELTIPFDEYPLVPYGAMFWMRKGALAPITDNPLPESFFPDEPLPPDGSILHALERIYSLIAQEAGYYSGWVLNRQSAERYIINSYYYDLKRKNILTQPGIHESCILLFNALNKKIKLSISKLWKKMKLN